MDVHGTGQRKYPESSERRRGTILNKNSAMTSRLLTQTETFRGGANRPAFSDSIARLHEEILISEKDSNLEIKLKVKKKGYQ